MPVEASSVYGPLHPERREIRLLTLETGSAEDAILATLSVLILDSGPHYEALSYVWGDPSMRCGVKLNGRDFENLGAALRRMRLESGLYGLTLCVSTKKVYQNGTRKFS